MPNPLLAVKLFVPQPRPDLTERGSLLARFEAGLRCPLTIVSAPAGFGKSTLVSMWIHHRESNAPASVPASEIPQVAWLSLDVGDNEALRFWLYVISALKNSCIPHEGERQPVFDDLIEALQGNTPPAIETLLDGLINCLTQLQESFLLILDDYHLIQALAIHEQMTYLLDHLPANVRLVILTRADPPLPLARLRVRGQLSEFRAADLRFSHPEVDAFLQRALGFHLPEEDLRILEKSTEGWIAGLQMAALAIQRPVTQTEPLALEQQETVHAFISSFSGNNVYILDYLTDEVFTRQPRDVQDFLLKTAILETMTAELCDAVLSEEENGVLPNKRNSRSILEYLDRANLFLIPLDHERRWFRYHHLFADLLRVRLQQQTRLQEQADERIPTLHQRAARWYEQAGSIDEAMQHCIAAQDWDRAAHLVETYSQAYLDRGQLATVLQWVDALPPESLRRRPNLGVQIIWAMSHAGKTQRVGPLLKEIEAALQAWEQQRAQTSAAKVDLTEQDVVRIRASLAIFRAYGLILASRPDQALQVADQALEQLPDLETREYAWLHWVVGYAQRGLGKIDLATWYFQKAVEISREGGKVWEDLSTDLGIAYRLSGRLEDAAQVFEESLRAGAQSGLRNKGNLSRVEAYLSAVRMEQNRVDEALAHARKAVDYLQWWPSHNHIATAYGFYGLALLTTGALEEAKMAIERADAEHHKGEVTPFVVRLIETARVRMWLLQESWQALKAWVESQAASLPEVAKPETLNEYTEMHLIILIRAWIGLGRWEKDRGWFQKAAQWLPVLSRSAQSQRRINAGIEIDLLESLVLWELARTGQGSGAGGVQDALEWVTRSLRSGVPGGYQRVYLNEGQAMRQLLAVWLEQDQRRIEASGVDGDMVRGLWEALNEHAQVDHQPGGLVEPLTEREREVLRLLALGLSNHAMAEKLVVSEGTIKTHVHNVLGKLGAQSRTHALALAKELKLL